jgi:uncharacterized membrane protein YphA (DoxX/SURF4 family)
MKILAISLRIFFAVLLMASAIGKLLDMPGFYTVVASYDLLPVAMIPAAAWMLTALELTLGIWVAVGAYLARAAILVATLHVMYFGWLGVALARGLSIPNCGCFGVYWPRPLTVFTLIEDAVLLMLAAALWRLSGRGVLHR